MVKHAPLRMLTILMVLALNRYVLFVNNRMTPWIDAWVWILKLWSTPFRSWVYCLSSSITVPDRYWWLDLYLEVCAADSVEEYRCQSHRTPVNSHYVDSNKVPAGINATHLLSPPTLFERILRLDVVKRYMYFVTFYKIDFFFRSPHIFGWNQNWETHFLVLLPN